jgi:uncharacterized protein (TIGR02145 family)
MKKLTSLFILLLLAVLVIAQAPESFKYQAVIRDASGNVRANANITIDIAILQGTANGSQVFIETHNVTTNDFGLVNLEIGSKNASGFAAMDWSAGPYFVKVSVDGTEMGTSQLLSVPYALYAKIAENGFSGDYDDLHNKPLIAVIDDASTSTTSSWSSSKTEAELNNKANTSVNLDVDKTDDVTLSENQTIGGVKTFNGTITVPAPVNSNDAVNKAYVDRLINLVLEKLLVDSILFDTRDSQFYKTVLIGDQIWMAENLAYLPVVSPPSIQSISEPNYYVYGYDGTNVIEAKTSSNYEIYGALYNWPAAMNSAESSNDNPSGVQGVCPSGWHLPSNAEWQQLEMYLGMDPSVVNDGFWRGTDEGGKLKETGNDHWVIPNTGANNITGFNALPGGQLHPSGDFVGIGEEAVFWTATGSSNSIEHAIGRVLMYNQQRIYSNGYHKYNNFSVRCVKD